LLSNYLLIHKIRAAFHLTRYEGKRPKAEDIVLEIYWGEKVAAGGTQQACNFETDMVVYRIGGELRITREPKLLNNNRHGFERHEETF